MLCITERGQSSGAPLASLEVDDRLFIELSNGSHVSAADRMASSDEIVIEGLNGKWRLTPHNRDNMPKSFDGWPGMYSTFWVVREGL